MVGGNLRIPDTSHNAFVCIAAFCLLQRNIGRRGPDIKARPNRQKKRPPVSGGLLGIQECRLFGGNLPRRIERAGIVDLRHLVVGKAQDLPQDLVGMLAE
jgi:hypothetical protein